MSLDFYCQCGRKLTVAEDQQGRKTTCPVCGIVVTVPRRRDHGPGGDLTMTLEFIERAGHRSPPIATVSLRSHARQTKWRRSRGLPTPFDIPWTDSLWLPFIEIWTIGRISLFLAIGLLLARTQLVTDFFLHGPTLVFAFLFGGTSFAFLTQFLSHVVTEGAAAAGELRLWTGFSLKGAIVSTVRWLVVMLAGPGFVLAFGVWYWIHCGPLALLDRFVLFEAAVLGCGWMVFGLLATRGDEPLRAAFPKSLARTVGEFGWESLGFALWAGAVFWTTSLFFLAAIDLGQRGEGLAVFVLCWSGFAFAIGASATLLHRLGVRYAQRHFVPPAGRTLDATKPAESAAV